MTKDWNLVVSKDTLKIYSIYGHFTQCGKQMVSFTDGERLYKTEERLFVLKYKKI